MRLNENERIICGDTVLVPYESFHVPVYHMWMKSPELQELTASEPLTLVEEYEMQKSWKEDSNKLTFIILSKSFVSPHESGNYDGAGMIGDVNLYFNDPDRAYEYAEIEVMIAESQARRNGHAVRALQEIIKYAHEKLGTRYFEAKILQKNSASIDLFKKLGFVQTSIIEIFEQVNLSLNYKVDLN